MSKNKKKLHLDASTEGENNSGSSANDFAIVGEGVDRFYDLFIGKRNEIANDDGFKFYETDSPFGPGKIIISNIGAWYDESSKQMGSMEDFLEKMFPTLTKPEALKGVSKAYFAYALPDPNPESKHDNGKGREMAFKIILACQRVAMAEYLAKRGISFNLFSD